MSLAAALRTRFVPAAAVALALTSAAVATGAVAGPSTGPRVRAATSTPGSFTARATGAVRGDRVRIAVNTWNAEGRPLRGMRVTVRVAGLGLRLCGRTSRRGRVTCSMPRRRTRPSVFVAAGGRDAILVRFWRYSGD